MLLNRVVLIMNQVHVKIAYNLFPVAVSLCAVPPLRRGMYILTVGGVIDLRSNWLTSKYAIHYLLCKSKNGKKLKCLTNLPVNLSTFLLIPPSLYIIYMYAVYFFVSIYAICHSKVFTPSFRVKFMPTFTMALPLS